MTLRLKALRAGLFGCRERHPTPQSRGSRVFRAAPCRRIDGQSHCRPARNMEVCSTAPDVGIIPAVIPE
jgi:hypothetical protein